MVPVSSLVCAALSVAGGEKGASWELGGCEAKTGATSDQVTLATWQVGLVSLRSQEASRGNLKSQETRVRKKILPALNTGYDPRETHPWFPGALASEGSITKKSTLSCSLCTLRHWAQEAV